MAEPASNTYGAGCAAICHASQLAVTHKVTRVLLKGRFLVAIHCQYIVDAAHPRCDEQFERLELDVTERDAGATESHGFRFVGSAGWHRAVDPPANEVS